MIKRILNISPILRSFIIGLNLGLSKPQMGHIYRVSDAIVTYEDRKTLSGLYRLFVEAPDTSAVCDCFRVSPWSGDDIRGPLQVFSISDLIARSEEEGAEKVIFISVDDSLDERDKATTKLEYVDWHHDHSESTRSKPHFKKGAVYVLCRIRIGSYSYTFDIMPYLRASTVRRINRNRPKGKRVSFRTKFKIARQMLKDLREFLPKGYKVYVLFDNWYASAKLIKFCLSQKWDVICALKYNRNLDGKPLYQYNQQLKHRCYTRVGVSTADGKSKVYLTRTLKGHLNDIPCTVSVIISKRHNRDSSPKYFLCTDLTLSPQKILNYYSNRWACEVDNWYLKEMLGLGDFRGHPYEAIDKWYSIILLTLVFLQWRLANEKSTSKRSVADIIRTHRLEHAREILIAACQQTLEERAIEPVLERFLPEDLPKAA